MNDGVFIAPHPFDESCNCGRCSARRRMKESTLLEQEELKKAQANANKLANQKKKGIKMSKLRAKLSGVEHVEETEEMPINFDVTLEDDIAPWFNELCKEFSKEPNEVFNIILRCQMESDTEEAE